MSNTQKIFQDSILWVRLAICANTHIKRALLNVVHNEINHPQVTGIPSDPKDLYTFLRKNNKVRNAKHLKKDQKFILLPISSQCVNSSLLDISLIRWLIQTFCGIKNAKGNWNAPDACDQSICANVYRAALMRNKIFHYDDVETLDEPTFETMWREMKDILKGLMYADDIEPMRTETLDITKIQGEMLKEFRDHLEDYKIEISKEDSPEVYVQRRFSVDKDPNNIVTEIDQLLNESDQINIFANAGVGKSVTARNIRYEWGKEKILSEFFLLYFDSKKMNPKIHYNSFSAPLFFSELGNQLRKKGKTEQNFKHFDCVQTRIENLFIIVDGVDELSIKGLNEDYVNDLETKVINNEKISAKDTIIAIYFRFLFPCSKICLLGRIGEFEHLEKLKSSHYLTIFSEKNRIISDLELLKFDDANIQEFTCLKTCNQDEMNEKRNCTRACIKIYEKIKDIELCKTPTDLNSLIELYKIELHKKYPNGNIGRITRTKLIIGTLLNRLNEHINRKIYFPNKTFGDIRRQKDLRKYLEGINVIGKISFKSLVENNVTVQVEEEQGNNGILYFRYKNEISIERKTLEELDFFYVRYFDYHFILEPYHTLNIEFLCACYFFSHPDKWNSILKLNADRQLAIISFIAGLHADDYFTKDFVKNVLNRSGYSLEQFFSWLYNVKNIRWSLPNGVSGYNWWFGLMENQKLSPSLFLLDSISHEVEIPLTFIPKTIVCYCNGYSFEWYNLNDGFKHNFLTNASDKLNIELFLMKFPSFKFIIKGRIWISNNDELYRLNQCGANNLITFKINDLNISSSHDTCFSSHFNVNRLLIGRGCDSRTIDMILNALSPPQTSINPQPAIQCKQIGITDISQFNSQQTEKLFELGLNGVVDYISISVSWSAFFTDRQISILQNVEGNSRKPINIELHEGKFNRVFDLPNLGNRNVYLRDVDNVTDNDVNEIQDHISSGYSHNLANYKIIQYNVPFVRKENYSQDYEQSMSLHLGRVDFTEVSADVFAKTLSLIPSISCVDSQRFDNRDHIPSPLWLRLSQIEDCQLDEMRIWRPQPKNFEHFLNTKTKMIQFICTSKDDLKQLLNHIVNNPNIQLDEEINVFIVMFDYYDWDYYQEIMLFGGKTIREYKKNYSMYDLKLENISVPFHEGEQHLKWWCCEISLPKNNNQTIMKITEKMLLFREVVKRTFVS